MYIYVYSEHLTTHVNRVRLYKDICYKLMYEYPIRVQQDLGKELHIIFEFEVEVDLSNSYSLLFDIIK